MTPNDFDYLVRIVRRRAGVSLAPGKTALVQRRLAGVMRRFDFKDMAALVGELRLGCEALAEAVTEAMLVNESSFFRDPALFATLRKGVLPRLCKARAHSRRLRIWSAAAAAGQEAYSIAILLSEMGLGRDGWTVELIATDYSAQALRRAETGRYTDFEVERGLDGHALRYFRRDGLEWAIDDGVRRMVSFRRFNLLDSYGWLDDLDVIFCRNVLMYFEPATRADILSRMTDVLADDGVLALGDAEQPEKSAFLPSADGFGFYAKPQSHQRLTA